MDLRVRHTTRYVYGHDVTFGPHRLMLRPRDSFDMRIMDTSLRIEPAATVAWMHDVYGNSIATANFAQPGQSLLIDSELVLRRYGSKTPRAAAGPWQGGAPIAYNSDEFIVLAPFMSPALTDPQGQLTAFAAASVSAHNETLGHPLLDLSNKIHTQLTYNMRFEEGTLAPLDTLARGTGTCRDYAWLFIECARHLGYAARFVSGYLHNFPLYDHNGSLEAMPASVGYSHAWAEVYVPGDGWVEFDPTNALVGDHHLIRVAVTRTPAEASPVSGSFEGMPGTSPPEVSVTIEQVLPQHAD